MTASIPCPCGAQVPVPDGPPGSFIRCTRCGHDLTGYQPPAANPTTEPILAEAVVEDAPPHWSQRMFAAMLDPRSIHWMLAIGGGLMVVGLAVWLVSQGIFENTLVVAGTLTAGSLLIHAAGCGTALKTRYKTAGHALAFLGCLLLPLNLWFYHSQGLLTLEGKLWVGGVVCCAIYIATVFLLRSPLFMFAVEGGITLTVLLLLGEQGLVTDATWLSVVLAALAFISIHAERAFPIEGEPFDRKRFGLPLFWSGHVQLAAAVGTLLGSQVLALILAPEQAWFVTRWEGNWLTQHAGAAAMLWLVGGYLYVYSDLAVRRVGWYMYAAATCLVGAELTLIGNFLPREWMIAAPAITALVITFLATTGTSAESFARRLTPLAVLLAGVSVLAGTVQHVAATSQWAAELGWQANTGWALVGTLILVAVCNRVMAVLQAVRSTWAADTHLFFSSAAVLVAVAGLLRCLEITSWTQQAPLVMLVPLAYLFAARLWQDKAPSWPLAISAQVGAAVILLHVLFNTIDTAGAYFVPVTGSIDNLWLGLVFIEAAIFYLAYAIVFKQEGNIYAATAAACAAVWQGAVFYNLADAWYTMLFAGLGLVLLTAARLLSYAEQEPPKKGALRLKAAFESAHALISLAFLSGLMQGLARLASHNADWPLLSALALTTASGLVAIAVAPNRTWRRVYAAWSIGLAGVSFLTLNVLITLTVWQKAELFAMVVGAVLLVIGYVGRFLERSREDSDHVTLALLFGSILPAGALLLAVLYYRFVVGEVSMPDELGLAAISVFLVITGYSWQLKMPTVIGGEALSMYLLVLIGMLAYFPNAAIGVYLAIGGGSLFTAGVLLSIFRERLSRLPQQISEREGVFQVLSWR